VFSISVIPVDPDLSGEEPESNGYLYGFRVKHGMTIQSYFGFHFLRLS